MYVIQLDSTGERLNTKGKFSASFDNVEKHKTLQQAKDRWSKKRLDCEQCSIVNISGQLF
jgi:hypothetical protein